MINRIPEEIWKTWGNAFVRSMQDWSVPYTDERIKSLEKTKILQAVRAINHGDEQTLSDICWNDERVEKTLMDIEKDPGLGEYLTSASRWYETNPDRFHVGPNIFKMLINTDLGNIHENDVIFPSMSEDGLIKSVYVSFNDILQNDSLKINGIFFGIHEMHPNRIKLLKQFREVFNEKDFKPKWFFLVHFNDHKTLQLESPQNNWSMTELIKDILQLFAEHRTKAPITWGISTPSVLQQVNDEEFQLFEQAVISAINTLLYWQHKQDDIRRPDSLKTVQESIQKTKNKLARMKSKEKKRKANIKLNELHKKQKKLNKIYLFETAPMEIKEPKTKDGEISNRKSPKQHIVRGFWRRVPHHPEKRQFIKPYIRGNGKAESKQWQSIYDKGE